MSDFVAAVEKVNDRSNALHELVQTMSKAEMRGALACTFIHTQEHVTQQDDPIVVGAVAAMWHLLGGLLADKEHDHSACEAYLAGTVKMVEGLVEAVEANG